jgi:hypothetical protein
VDNLDDVKREDRTYYRNKKKRNMKAEIMELMSYTMKEETDYFLSLFLTDFSLSPSHIM